MVAGSRARGAPAGGREGAREGRAGCKCESGGEGAGDAVQRVQEACSSERVWWLERDGGGCGGVRAACLGGAQPCQSSSPPAAPARINRRRARNTPLRIRNNTLETHAPTASGPAGKAGARAERVPIGCKVRRSSRTPSERTNEAARRPSRPSPTRFAALPLPSPPPHPCRAPTAPGPLSYVRPLAPGAPAVRPRQRIHAALP